MPALASPLHELKSAYDAVVIGSGYGGAVAACRLARAGLKVAVLERGRERQTGDFPRTLDEVRDEFRRGHSDRGEIPGLFAVHEGPEVHVLSGVGLGGSSLIDAGVAATPRDEAFADARWPSALRADRVGLAQGFERARTMLAPVPVPGGPDAFSKTAALRAAAGAMGASFELLPLGIAFEARVNHAGVAMRPCIACGDCVTGCNHGAKASAALTYLPDARAHGAQLFAGIDVGRISPRASASAGARWLVHFQLGGAGRERFEAPSLFIAADIVVVAAGAFGSAEILQRSKRAGLPVSAALGRGVHVGGLGAGFATGVRRPIKARGLGDDVASSHAAVGPTVTAFLEKRDGATAGPRVSDGASPGPLLRLAGRGLPGSVDAALPVHTLLQDGVAGQLDFDDAGVARARCEPAALAAHTQKAESALQAVSAAVGGTFTLAPVQAAIGKHGRLGLFATGGACMADDASGGVVDHEGRVFSAESGAAVHEGLYVCDAAVISAPLGCAPTLTIAALAERLCARLLQARGVATIDGPSAQPPPERPRLLGLQFTERMLGHVSMHERADFQLGVRAGRDEGARFEFVLTLLTEDLNELLNAPDHPARSVGTVAAPALSPAPLTVTGGRFNLFVDNPTTPGTRRMRYQMQMVAEDGRTFTMDGFKVIHDDRGPDMWSDTTTLFVTLYAGPSTDGEVLGKGILRIVPEDFARQMMTLRALNARGSMQATGAKMAFARLFAGALWNSYVEHGPNPAPRRRPVRRVLGAFGKGVGGALLVGLGLFGFRGQFLRQQPPVAGDISGHDLPGDVAALGLPAHLLQGFDLRPGHYRIDRFDFGCSWVEDNIVQVHGGLAAIPLHPQSIGILKDVSLRRGFINLTLLHDASGATVGVGSQIETVALDSNPLSHNILANTDWSWTIPGRGVLFLSQKEGGKDLGELQEVAKKAKQAWEGRRAINHTVGPLRGEKGSPLEGDNGIVHGGTGEFAGAVGIFQEWNILTRVPVEGDMVATSEYKLVLLRPVDGRGGRVSAPPVDPHRPREVITRAFEVDLPTDLIYRTAGPDLRSTPPPSPSGMVALPGAALSRTAALLMKMRDERGRVVGEAGAAYVAEADGPAQWTLTVPGEGTLQFVSDGGGAAGAGEIPAQRGGVLPGGRGVLMGGTGVFARATGHIREAWSAGWGRVTLHVTIQR